MFNTMYVRKFICLLLAISTFSLSLTGCGGHTANPVDRYMLGDEKKSCTALYAEVSNIDKEIALKNRDKTNRDTWNVIFFVTGFLVIVPWFFIDAKGSQEVEMEALKARKNALQINFSDKNCDTPTAINQKNSPSTENTNSSSIKSKEKNVSNETVVKASVENLGRISSQQEKCNFCERTIPKFEQHFPLFDNKIACKECYAKLKNQIKEQ